MYAKTTLLSLKKKNKPPPQKKKLKKKQTLKFEKYKRKHSAVIISKTGHSPKSLNSSLKNLQIICSYCSNTFHIVEAFPYN